MKAIVRILATYELDLPENGDVALENDQTADHLRLIHAEVMDIVKEDQCGKSDQQFDHRIKPIVESSVPRTFGKEGS